MKVTRVNSLTFFVTFFLSFLLPSSFIFSLPSSSLFFVLLPFVSHYPLPLLSPSFSLSPSFILSFIVTFVLSFFSGVHMFAREIRGGARESQQRARRRHPGHRHNREEQVWHPEEDIEGEKRQFQVDNITVMIDYLWRVYEIAMAWRSMRVCSDVHLCLCVCFDVYLCLFWCVSVFWCFFVVFYLFQILFSSSGPALRITWPAWCPRACPPRRLVMKTGCVTFIIFLLLHICFDGAHVCVCVREGRDRGRDWVFKLLLLSPFVLPMTFYTFFSFIFHHQLFSITSSYHSKVSPRKTKVTNPLCSNRRTEAEYSAPY